MGPCSHRLTTPATRCNERLLPDHERIQDGAYDPFCTGLQATKGFALAIVGIGSSRAFVSRAG
jgi:hypothetical protein